MEEDKAPGFIDRTPNVIPKEAREMIIKNCTMSGEELRQIIKQKYDVDVSVQAVIGHLKKARANAEEATRTADAHLSQTISERVANYAPRILARYEKELERIESILDGTSNEFILSTGDDGSRDKYWASKYTKLYDDLSKSYLALRPPIQTVRIESTVDPDIVLMDTWTDEQITAYEKFLKAMKTTGES
jgi:hypothetical protein